MRPSAIHIYANFPEKSLTVFIWQTIQSVNFLLRHPVVDIITLKLSDCSNFTHNFIVVVIIRLIPVCSKIIKPNI